MTEKIYDALWEFTKLHKDDVSVNPNESKILAILTLYQDSAEVPLSLKTAIDIEEACQCIRMALKYAF